MTSRIMVHNEMSKNRFSGPGQLDTTWTNSVQNSNADIISVIFNGKVKVMDPGS